MSGPLVTSYWRGSDGTHGDRFGNEDSYTNGSELSTCGHYDRGKPYSLSPTNGSMDYPYVDESIPLSTGRPSWPLAEDGNFNHRDDASLKTSNSYTDPFLMDQMDSALPRQPSQSSTWPNTDHLPDTSPPVYDRSTGGNTDDAFAAADAIEDQLVWKWSGKRASVKPSKAVKCLRASERINERIAALPSSHKSSRMTPVSSKSISKSHSKSSHSTHHKKKSSRN